MTLGFTVWLAYLRCWPFCVIGGLHPCELTWSFEFAPCPTPSTRTMVYFEVLSPIHLCRVCVSHLCTPSATLHEAWNREWAQFTRRSFIHSSDHSTHHSLLTSYLLHCKNHSTTAYFSVLPILFTSTVLITLHSLAQGPLQVLPSP